MRARSTLSAYGAVHAQGVHELVRRAARQVELGGDLGDLQALAADREELENPQPPVQCWNLSHVRYLRSCRRFQTTVSPRPTSVK
jgi:hypothetical protein